MRSCDFTNKRIFLENLTKSCIFHKVWSWINPLDMQMVTGFANLLNARKLEFIKVCNSTQWLLEERNRKKTRIENFILQLFSKIFNVISRKWLWGLLKLECTFSANFSWKWYLISRIFVNHTFSRNFLITWIGVTESRHSLWFRVWKGKNGWKNANW